MDRQLRVHVATWSFNHDNLFIYILSFFRIDIPHDSYA